MLEGQTKGLLVPVDSKEVGAFSRAFFATFGRVFSVRRSPCSRVVSSGWMLDLDDFRSVDTDQLLCIVAYQTFVNMVVQGSSFIP